MFDEKVNHVHDGNGDDNDDYDSRDYDYGQLLMQGQRSLSVAAFTAAFAVFQKTRPGNHGGYDYCDGRNGRTFCQNSLEYYIL